MSIQLNLNFNCNKPIVTTNVGQQYSNVTINLNNNNDITSILATPERKTQASIEKYNSIEQQLRHLCFIKNSDERVQISEQI